MDDPFRLHEGVGNLLPHREPGQRPVPRRADNHRGIDLVAILALPDMSAFLALELGDVQRQRDPGLALDQFEVVRDVVFGGLEADAARLHAFGRQREADLLQLADQLVRCLYRDAEMVDVAGGNGHARSYSAIYAASNVFFMKGRACSIMPPMVGASSLGRMSIVQTTRLRPSPSGKTWTA